MTLALSVDCKEVIMPATKTGKGPAGERESFKTIRKMNKEALAAFLNNKGITAHQDYAQDELLNKALDNAYAPTIGQMASLTEDEALAVAAHNRELMKASELQEREEADAKLAARLEKELNRQLSVAMRQDAELAKDLERQEVQKVEQENEAKVRDADLAQRMNEAAEARRVKKMKKQKSREENIMKGDMELARRLSQQSFEDAPSGGSSPASPRKLQKKDRVMSKEDLFKVDSRLARQLSIEETRQMSRAASQEDEDRQLAMRLSQAETAAYKLNKARRTKAQQTGA